MGEEALVFTFKCCKQKFNLNHIDSIKKTENYSVTLATICFSLVNNACLTSIQIRSRGRCWCSIAGCYYLQTAVSNFIFFLFLFSPITPPCILGSFFRFFFRCFRFNSAKYCDQLHLQMVQGSDLFTYFVFFELMTVFRISFHLIQHPMFVVVFYS